MSFAHLRIHTHYSVNDSIVKLPELFARASELGLDAIAITDPSVMSGVPEFLSLSLRYPEITPIIGCEFNLTNPSLRNSHDADKHKLFPVVLLAKNLAGYHNLVKLSSIANTGGVHLQPRISYEQLKDYHEGLVCLSGGIDGEVSQTLMEGGRSKARKIASWYKALFGEDYYFEVTLHKRERNMRVSPFDNCTKLYSEIDERYSKEKKIIPRLVKLGQELGIKLVATNPVLFLHRDDAVAHDAFFCYQNGQRIANDDRPRFSHLEYLRSEDEMRKLFARYQEAIDNTKEVADKVERFRIHEDSAMPTVSDNPSQDLREAVYSGAAIRYGNINDAIRDRIEYELSNISRLGFDSYFLIVKEMIDWTRQARGSVGPGRGSAPGSIVNYCLGITDVDPLEYGLLFERFLNPERNQLPDIDIDFNACGLDEVTLHLCEKYGNDKTSHVICFHPMGASDQVEVSAKAYGIQSGRIAKIKNIVSWRSSLSDVLNHDLRLQHEYSISTPRMQEALQTATKLEGVICRTGMHACANLVSAVPVSDRLPLLSARMKLTSKRGEKVVPLSQYDVRWAEEAGVLKFDVLGLITLDIIRDVTAEIHKTYGIDVNLGTIPLDDDSTFRLYQNGDTPGVFQFESEGMREWLARVHPDNFSHLVALDSMYRPGPMDFLPEYVSRKEGVERINYIIPETEEILSETFGMILYQEQIMLIAQRIAGFTPGESDKLRKLFGRYNHKSIILYDSFHDRFIEGGGKNGYDYKTLERLWQKLEKPGPYAFLKAHAVAYTRLSYQTAWLKAHYRELYMEIATRIYKKFGVE